MPNSVRLLYIDDDEALSRLVEKALSRTGLRVRLAATADEGLAAVAEQSFDAIALDHNLGARTGLDILPQLTATGAPVIYVTGSDDVQVAVAALKAGAADYVVKDVAGHFRELLSTVIASAVEQARLKREREEHQQQIAKAKERAELLLLEINHRVANSLALVASVARLQARMLTDEAARHALADMEMRIGAIASIHRVLYTSAVDNLVDLDVYLKTLVEELRKAMHADNRAHTIEVEASTGASASAEKTVALGVIVTELVTNAYKYAYPAGVDGRIRVMLTRQSDDALELVVEDFGVGVGSGEAKPKGSGLGSRMVKSMAASIGSEVRQEPTAAGTRMVLAFGV